MDSLAIEAAYQMARWNVVFNFATRALALAIGAACMFIGLRLYMRELRKRDTTEVKASWGDKKLAIANAAPGAFFAIAGLVIVVTVVLTLRPVNTRYDFKREQTSTQADSGWAR